MRYKPIGARISRAVGTGNYEITKQGKRKEILEYKSYIKTKEGEIEEETWIRKATEEIRTERMGILLDQVKDHCSRLPFLKTEKDLNMWALECVYNEAYTHWEDFTIIWG